MRDERKLRLGSPLRDVRGERQRKAEMHSDPASESDIQGGIRSEIPAKGKKKKKTKLIMIFYYRVLSSD